MPLDEGIELMKKGFKEINERFLVGGATFTLKVIKQHHCIPAHLCIPRAKFCARR
jgi:hypothetical protein